jgi:ketosteroid isomerase-like protein
VDRFVRKKFSFAALLLALLCTPAVADEAADRAAIEAAAQSWITAYNVRDVGTIITMSTSDIALLDATMDAVKGERAVREAVQNAPANRVTSTTEEIVIDGEVAWRIGKLEQKNSRNARSLEIWHRTDDGWKLRRQMSAGLLARVPLLRPPVTEPRLDEQKQTR